MKNETGVRNAYNKALTRNSEFRALLRIGIALVDTVTEASEAPAHLVVSYVLSASPYLCFNLLFS